jgi:hypothetical protein
MRLFEIEVATVFIRRSGGPSDASGRLAFALPEEAEDLLTPIMKPYQQSPMFYFDLLNFGRPPAPWAIACLDRQYALAGHVATVRPADSGISFSPYRSVPSPLPADFTPEVGVIVFASKAGLERARGCSALFDAAWSALGSKEASRRWLLLLDAPPDPWLRQTLPGDAERWRTRPR